MGDIKVKWNTTESPGNTFCLNLTPSIFMK